MKKTLFALFCLALLVPSLASAQVVAPSMRRVKFSGSAGTAFCADAGVCPVLNAVALNGSAASRTFVLKTLGMSKLSMQINYTYSAATAVTLACSGSLDYGATYGRLTSTAIGAGTGTMTAYTDSYAGTATANFIAEYDVRTFGYFKCTVAGSGSPGAGDLVTIYAVAAVGQ